MPHTIEITCYADLEELIASIVKLVGEISGKEVCQRNADDLRQAAVAIETMLAESAAIPPAVALLARCPECGSYDRESCARPYHICLNLWHKPPVQDHGPRVDTKGQTWKEKVHALEREADAAASQEAGRGTEEK